MHLCTVIQSQTRDQLGHLVLCQLLVTVPSPCRSKVQELSALSPSSPNLQQACCWYTSASCGRNITVM